MIGLFIAIAACVYFFVEAKKREQHPVKWSLIAFISFLGPQIAISWLALPVALVLLGVPLEQLQETQVVFALLGFGIGFYLLVVARRRLYRYQRIEKDEGTVLVKSMGIITNEDGTYTVADKTFDSKSDADQYAALLKSLM